MSALLRTADQPVSDRADFWRYAMGEYFLPHEMTIDGEDGFYGLLRARSIGPMQVADATAGAHHVARTAKLCAQTDTDYYKVGMPLRGYCLVSQDGREAPLLPGDITVYDTSRPYSLTFNDTCQMALLMFPQRFLRLSHDDMRDVTASRISGRYGIGTLASPLLRNLVLHIDEFSDAQSMQLADTVFDLLATAFCEHIGKSATPVVGTTQTLLLRIKTFIENHLDDSDLTPDTVAAAVHISTGYLHKLFRMHETTVSRFIRERRLEHCRRDLIAPDNIALPISTIGARWGLIDAAHFSRVFKAAYGASPREYRLTHDLHGDYAMEAARRS
jgi:AraC-like DNA-binding protein